MRETRAEWISIRKGRWPTVFFVAYGKSGQLDWLHCGFGGRVDASRQQSNQD
jgi:hypothetical protein